MQLPPLALITTLVLLPQVTKYILSYYWAVVTIATVGYGDINPATDYERIYATFVCFVGTVAFGFMMGQVVLRRLLNHTLGTSC